MKQLLHIFFSIVLTMQCIGQATFSFKPSTVIVSVPKDTDEVIGHISIRNTAAVAKSYTWQRVVNQMTTGWETLICDKEQCHGSMTSKQTFVLTAGEESRLDVHARPNGIAGTANIDLIVSETNNSTNTGVAKYLFNTSTATKEVDKSNLRIAPNPVQDFFTIMDETEIVEEISIYNMIGRQMKNFKSVGSGQKINISDFPDGIYLIRLLSKNGNTLKTLRINKVKLRA
jgi:Secretion system C-terminal sorting domain